MLNEPVNLPPPLVVPVNGTTSVFFTDFGQCVVFVNVAATVVARFFTAVC